MKCLFCLQDLREEYEVYRCDTCSYSPRYFFFHPRAGSFVIDFWITFKEKLYIVACWIIPGTNIHEINKPSTGIYYLGERFFLEEGRIISGPEDAYNYLQRVLSLGAFL